MKRAGNLLPQIADSDNLRLAWIKAVRGKRAQKSVLAFRKNLGTHLAGIASDLLRGEYVWGGYRRFTIYDPKEREIKVAPLRDRITYHAISNICMPHFERFQIDQSCACRGGKGGAEALRLARSYSRAGRWFLKLDIRKYFDSVSHDILKRLLARLFKDRQLLDLFETLIDSYQSSPGCGIPIGSLTSQYFANHYLGYLDHYVKEQLHSSSYVRYMDDFILWEDRKEKLFDHLKKIEDFLTQNLALTLKPPCINRMERGLTFLGYIVYPGKVRLSPRSRLRFREKYRKAEMLFRNGVWDEETLIRHTEPLFAFVKHAESESFRRRLLKEFGIEP